MGAALSFIGVGLNAVGTLAGIGSASSSARAQKQAIADQELLSEDRLRLLQENFKYSQQWANENAQSEMLTLRAQKAQSMQAITEQVLTNRAAITQARLAAAGIRADTAQAVNRLLADAANAQAETSVNAANTLEAGVGMLGEAGGELSKAAASQSANETVSSRSLSNNASQERFAQSAIEQLTRMQENVLSADAAVNRNNDATQKGAAIQKSIGALQAGYADATTDIQQQANALYEPFARSQTNKSYRRNRKGILAKNATAAASASASYAAQVAGERTTQANLAAQRSQIKSPGFLSYLSAGVGLASQGYQAGLFSLGGGGNRASAATAAATGQVEHPYNMPSTSQLKNFQSVVRPSARPTVPYQQYTDVTGNIYG